MSIANRMQALVQSLGEAAKDRAGVVNQWDSKYEKLPGRQKRKFLKMIVREKDKYHPLKKTPDNGRKDLGMASRRDEVKRRLQRVKETGIPRHK